MRSDKKRGGPCERSFDSEGIWLRKLDDSGRVWGTTLKVEQLPADVPERCVYVKAQALGGGIDRPVFGNFAVPFVRCR